MNAVMSISVLFESLPAREALTLTGNEGARQGDYFMPLRCFVVAGIFEIQIRALRLAIRNGLSTRRRVYSRNVCHRGWTGGGSHAECDGANCRNSGQAERAGEDRSRAPSSHWIPRSVASTPQSRRLKRNLITQAGNCRRQTFAHLPTAMSPPSHCRSATARCKPARRCHSLLRAKSRSSVCFRRMALRPS